MFFRIYLSLENKLLDTVSKANFLCVNKKESENKNINSICSGCRKEKPQGEKKSIGYINVKFEEEKPNNSLCQIWQQENLLTKKRKEEEVKWQKHVGSADTFCFCMYL